MNKALTNEDKIKPFTAIGPITFRYKYVLKMMQCLSAIAVGFRLDGLRKHY